MLKFPQGITDLLRELQIEQSNPFFEKTKTDKWLS